MVLVSNRLWVDVHDRANDLQTVSLIDQLEVGRWGVRDAPIIFLEENERGFLDLVVGVLG